jgi:hypothetical protein
MSLTCVALSDFNFSSEDSSSLEDDEKVNYKKKEGDFTRLCLMTKGGCSWNDSDSDVSDDLTYDGLSSKVPYHTPFRDNRNEASIRVPRMFNSHI